MFIPLKIKLTLYTLFFIIASMVTMGVVSDDYLHGYFQDSAKKQLKEGFHDLALQLKLVEKDLLESLYLVSENEAMIASLNLIKNYEDHENYNKIIFDEEKKRIVEILRREGQYAPNDHIAVYDDEYRLVAYADKEEEKEIYGFVSYENGKPLYFMKKGTQAVYELSDPPEHIVRHRDGIARGNLQALRNGEVVYDRSHGKLHLWVTRTIMRKIGDTTEVIGYMEGNNVVSRIEMNHMVDKRDLFIDYYFSDELTEKASVDQQLFFDRETYVMAPLLFSQYEADELSLGDSEYIFFSGVKLPMYKGALLVTAQIDKHELHLALKQSRLMLVLILVLIVFFTMLISLIALNWMITVPLKGLLEGIGIISKGEYSHEITTSRNDEFGVISTQFNEMARKVCKREHELDELAHHDVLTKLPNRIMFQEQLEVAISRARRTGHKMAVFFVDLDEFKSINDTLGHDVGDSLLVEMASNLAGAMRKDDLLARIGGDEFNVLIENLDSPVFAEEVANKLIEVMKKPMYIGEEQINITGSIGITIFPDDGDDSVSLLKNADLAMYYAKERGRNRYHFFSEELESSLKQRTIMLKELKNALLNDELVLYYQPKFSLKDGTVFAAEALIRWENPKLGFVRPDQFISLAEESGEIVAIGAWVVRQACEDFAEWKKLGLSVKQISVNVSNIQFAQTDIIDVLQDAMAAAGLESGELEVEMTESYIHENSEKALEVLHRIRSLGIDLAIDDFGTGYSSMSYLKRLPLSRLKIDKSFIEDIPHDSEDTEITKIIITLAKVMNLSITAEGVETLEQMRFLQQLECDEGQGYLCSKPLPFKNFVALLQENFSCTAHTNA